MRHSPASPPVSLTAVLAVFYGIVCAAFVLLAGWSLYQSRQDELRTAEVTVRNLAHSLEYGVTATFEDADYALQVVVDEVRRWNAGTRRDDRDLDAMLERQVKRVRSLQALLVADRDGRLRYGKGVDRNAPASVADRAYFAEARDNPDSGLLISEPLQGRLTSRPQIVLVRRISCADGSFCGVAFAPLYLDQFNQQFSTLDVGTRGLVTLRNGKSELLARYPPLESPDGRPGSVAVSPELRAIFAAGAQEAAYVADSPLDGIRRTLYYRRFADVPVYVIVGLSMDEALAGWRMEAVKTVGSIGLLMLLLGAGLWKFHQVWQQEQDFRQRMIDSIPGAFYLFDDTGRFLMWNRNFETVLGLTADEIAGSHPLDFFDPKDRPVIENAIRQVFETGEVTVEAPFSTRDGRRIPYFFNGFRLEIDKRPALIGIGLDISDRKRIEADLRIAAVAFESHEAMVITDVDGVVLRVNRAFSELTGYAPGEIVGRTTSMLKSGRHDAEFYRAMWESIARTGGWEGEIWDRHKDGRVYPKWLAISAVRGEGGNVTHYVGTQYDITERKQAEAQINELAFFDQLTRLPNRVLLTDRLKQALAASLRNRNYGALIFIDLDNFKTLNDTQGHEMGDLLLIQVAERIRQCVREEDTAARIGGDEFVVVLSGLGEDEKEAASTTEQVAEKILAALDQPYLIGRVVHRSTASIGATLFGRSPLAVDDLMKQADLAMYRSKESGRNVVCFFDPAMEAAVKQRAELEDDLRRAIEEGQLVLHYQAQVVGEGRVTGAEVLVRWRHPRRGLLSPAEFIPLAEDTELILPIGRWVLQTACARLAAWAGDPGMEHLTIAVNVSAKQFRQPDFVRQVVAALEETGANPHRLKLELTESLLVQDVEQIIEKMFALRAKGVGFALDDFGTGYSSLSYLKRLPLDQLKIDRSFIRDVLSDANDAAIAHTVVALAQSLGLAVIAEGVETRAQQDILAGFGCHAYQGYLFSRPVEVEGFERLARAEYGSPGR